MTTITQRLALLRTKMREANIAAYIVPTTDEYLGEYVPEQNKRLAYLSGFTGSAGTLVVTQEQAALFVDGRYTLQALNQCPTPLFEHHHLINEPVLAWLKVTLIPGQSVALDGRVVSYRFFKTAETELRELDITLQALTHNPIDDIWKDRPAALASVIRGIKTLFKRSSTVEGTWRAYAFKGDTKVNITKIRTYIKTLIKLIN